MAKNIIIAGAGPSGMCAAIAAARDGASVTVIEKNDTVGKKLSMTGNGRCNLSNLRMSADDFNENSRDRMKKWLSLFGVKDTINFFKSLGVVVMSEDGYLYPISGQAKTVTQALYNECLRLGVSFIFSEQLKSIAKNSEVFNVKTSKNEYVADAVIVAVGGLAGPGTTMSTGDGYYICEKLGMSKKDTYPALCSLVTDDDSISGDFGIRMNARASFLIGDGVFATEEGEVQITKNSLSGIPIMQSSGLVCYHLSKNRPVTVSIDFFPEYTDEEFEALVDDMLRLAHDRRLKDLLLGFCNQGITDLILGRMKLSPDMKAKNVGESMLRCVLQKYRDVRFNIVKTADYKKAQVTRGGISLGDLDDNLMCVKSPGVFVIGELCDVDGRCGGYNLQWAWCSGYIAGGAASCL